MYISEIKEIKNYRNLSGTKFKFDRQINFIVGENNIGKTNVLELLNCLLFKGKFDEEDFNNIKEPIEITFSVKYTDDEIGFFENNFDIDNELKITIKAIQENVDTRIEYYHSSGMSAINFRTIKMMNFVYYSSLRTPIKELNFTKNIGTGKVLNYLMKNSLEKLNIKEVDLFDLSGVEDIVNHLNRQIEKLYGISGDKIYAFVNEDIENLVNRILQIGDKNRRNINKLGDGLQYSFNIFLNILELLINLKTTKTDDDFENLLITFEDGRKYIPIILAFDEPEIHQHPYRQRALIKSINRIINNKNENFKKLIKDLFDIDGFIGQVFVVTHSPNILLDDYKQIIRIYKKGNNIEVICGQSKNFDLDVHKHLKRSFIYIKEAMFSKHIILVEGDTELGAIPVFVNRMNRDIDDLSIGVIKLDGADSVLKCMKLYNAFKINSTAIIDKDKKDKYSNTEGIFFTEEDDFETEIFSNFKFDNYRKYLQQINKINCIISFLKKECVDFNVMDFIENPIEYKIPDEIGEKYMIENKEKELRRLRENKNTINGALLAEFVDEIPNSFKSLIIDAIKKVDSSE